MKNGNNILLIHKSNNFQYLNYLITHVPTTETMLVTFDLINAKFSSENKTLSWTPSCN